MQSPTSPLFPQQDFSALTWETMSIFLTVSRTRTVREAAQKLAQKQAVVDQKLRELEDSLGARLLSRGKKEIKLTPEGQALQRYFETLEIETALLADRVKGADDCDEGEVILTAPNSLGLNLIAPNLVCFAKAHPGITLDLILTSCKLDLMDRQADISVRIGAPVQPSLDARRLGSVKFFLYASESYLERFGRPESLDDLQDHRFVDVSGELETSCQSQILSRIAPEARRAVKTNCTSTQFQAIEDGMGIGMLPDYQANYQVKTGAPLLRLLPEKVAAKEQVWLLCHPDLKRFARARAVIEFVTEVTRADLAE